MRRAFLTTHLLSAAQATLVAAAIACACLGSAHAELLYTSNGSSISRFDSTALGAVTTVPVTGLAIGETLVGIDLRPSTGQLFGIGSSSRVYVIVPTTGVATQVGTAGAFTLNGTAFGTDFNPTADRIRLVSNTEQNLRLNPTDGTLAGTDTALNPAGNIVSVAYDRNDNSASTLTTLFGIDSAAGTLVRIGGPDGSPSPNLGAVTTVGSLGLGTNLNEAIGFDISATGVAYATITTGGISRLYTINLNTGAATLASSNGGAIGSGTTPFLGVTAAAVAPPPVTTNTLLYRSGDQVPGESAGTVFADFGLPALEGGRFGFQATIVKEGVREPVIIGGASPGVLLRKDADAPGTTAKFAGFADAVFGGSHYAVIGKLKPGPEVSGATNEGIWSDATGTLQLVARKGAMAPDADEAKFLSFLSFALPPSGGPAFIARLKPGTGTAGHKVTPATDVGLWRESGGVTRLIIREGMTIPIDDVRTVKSFQAFALVPGSEDQRRSHRLNGDLLILAAFTDGSQVILLNPLGTTTLSTQTLSGTPVATPPGATLRQLGLPAANVSAFSFPGFLTASDTVDAANDAAIFRQAPATIPVAVAQEGSAAPDSDGATFSTFGAPIAAPGNVTIFPASLRIGSGVPRARADNDTGLWMDVNGTLQLLARESYAAPETPGGFAKFLSVAVNPDALNIRAVAFTAQLQNGVGGVKPATNTGLWVRNVNGIIELLCRTGDVIALGGGETATVTKIDALKASPRSAGQGRALNTFGQVIYRVTLGRAGQAVFLAQMP